MENLRLGELAFEAFKKLGKGFGFTKIRFGEGEVLVVDVGLRREVSEDEAFRVAEISMGCLGEVKRLDERLGVEIPKFPAVATLSCQLAGWAIKLDGSWTLGSGPARVPARRPRELVDVVGYYEKPRRSVLLLETEKLPDPKTLGELLKEAGVSELGILVFRSDSMAGVINILARVIEVGIFRLHNLGYDPKRVLRASGTVPMLKGTSRAMVEANDAIIYDGRVELECEGWDPSLTELAVSRASKAYGKSFGQLLEEVRGDFYKLDPSIFAPASLRVLDKLTGRVYGV